jgi:hypothetical protein
VPGQNKGVIPIKWLNHPSEHYIGRFEVKPTEPTWPVGHEVSNANDDSSKDIIISNSQGKTRGSPSPAVLRAGGNLVGRGIANPMSERTRGFEILSSLCCFGISEKEDRTKFPLPALIYYNFLNLALQQRCCVHSERLQRCGFVHLEV